jgi:hypothetical protein
MEATMQDHQGVLGYDRVRAHASPVVNTLIDRQIDGNIVRAQRDPEFAAQRLAELEREWDLDRTIMLGFAAAGTVALVLGLRRDWRWRFPLGAQIAFLALHSVIGWCPPAVILRRLGFRTRQEIESERFALSVTHAPVS